MSEQVLPSRKWARLALLASLVLAQAGCLLTSEVIHRRRVYNSYTCRATLVDTTSGQRRVVDSSMLDSTAPGAPARTFFDKDWDGNGTENEADVLLDWRRYLTASVLTSRNFAGGTWCVRPSDVSCRRGGRFSFTGAEPSALPEGSPMDCPVAPPDARLQVSAPGLTADSQLPFPDTAVGDTSAPVTFTVTNPSAVPLRVNGVGFVGGGDAPDFVKTADACLPTPAEMSAGRGHLLSPGGSCTFQLQFRPQHRDGVAVCAGGAPDESCRRRARLSVTGELNLERTALAPVNVELSGRALGGHLVVVTGEEVCFTASVPGSGWCTEWRVIRLRNDGPGVLTVHSAGITSGAGGGGFQQLAPTPTPLTLGPGDSAELSVRFCNMGNDADGAFTINSSDPRRPTVVVNLVNPLRRRCP